MASQRWACLSSLCQVTVVCQLALVHCIGISTLYCHVKMFSLYGKKSFSQLIAYITFGRLSQILQISHKTCFLLHDKTRERLQAAETKLSQIDPSSWCSRTRRVQVARMTMHAQVDTDCGKAM